MKPPEFVTFTGADDSTSIASMRALSALYPVEWGVLLSPKREGVGRYPSRMRRLELANEALHGRFRLALHVCGAAARNLLDLDLWPDVNGFSRVQINASAIPSERTIQRTIDRALELKVGVIFQWRNPTLFPTHRVGVEWLFDQSGGRGLEPEAWPQPINASQRVGYAGGIGPSNVRRVVEKIGGELGIDHYWLDMESGVRTSDDRFDLDACLAVCESIWGTR